MSDCFCFALASIERVSLSQLRAVVSAQRTGQLLTAQADGVQVCLWHRHGIFRKLRPLCDHCTGVEFAVSNLASSDDGPPSGD